MKLCFLKFKIALFIAVLVVNLSVFSNRLTLAKTPAAAMPLINIDNLPAEFVFTTNLSGVSRDVFQKINYERQRKRLSSMHWNEDLADLAYDYSETMAEEGFFDHEDNDGNTIVERAAKYKIRGWKKLGENLFQCYGYRNPADVAVKGWLGSPSHRDNIYDPEWTHTGIGVYKTRDGEYYITQVFMKK
jgi:uncharacterized protein YkwD